SDPHRRAIRQRNFLRQQRRNPVTPHQISHRCAGTDASQEFVFFSGKHGHSPLTDGFESRVSSFESDVLKLDEASVVGQAETPAVLYQSDYVGGEWESNYVRVWG